MALGETFDLGRIYAQAEAIKSARSDREYKKNYMEHLNAEERRHWAKMQQENQFKTMYTEIVQVEAMPEEQQREWLAKQPIGQDPRFKDAPTADVIRAIKNGVLVGLDKNPMDEQTKESADRRLYLEEGGDPNDPKAFADWRDREHAPEPKHSSDWQLYVDEGGDPRDRKAFAQWRRDEAARKDSTTKDGALPVGVSNSIARAVADALGGIVKINANGEVEIQVLDPKLRPQILATRARAERAWMDSKMAGREISPGEAVVRATADAGSRPSGGRGGARNKPATARQEAAPVPSPAAPQQSAPQQRAYNPQTGQWAVLVNGQWVIEK